MVLVCWDADKEKQRETGAPQEGRRGILAQVAQAAVAGEYVCAMVASEAQASLEPFLRAEGAQ